MRKACDAHTVGLVFEQVLIWCAQKKKNTKERRKSGHIKKIMGETSNHEHEENDGDDDVCQSP